MEQDCATTQSGMFVAVCEYTAHRYSKQCIEQNGNNIEHFSSRRKFYILCRYFCTLNINYTSIKTGIIIIKNVYTYVGCTLYRLNLNYKMGLYNFTHRIIYMYLSLFIFCLNLSTSRSLL